MTHLKGVKNSHIQLYSKPKSSHQQLALDTRLYQAIVSKSQGIRHQGALDTHLHVCEVLMLEPQRQQDGGLAVGEGGRQLFQEIEAREGGN